MKCCRAAGISRIAAKVRAQMLSPYEAAFASLLHEQKVLPCMKLWGNLSFFLLLLFFLFVGVGGKSAAHGIFADVVLAARVMPRLSFRY